ncbi:mechanosensitive ion channel family protein [Lysobacter auxotrophicus]|uniref:Small-conductance mechanosensitive channel n=1 Tax=Lysobacter auxotrophicus TaxID=2992573 RepID=A0ABM8DCS0_9GAMM|nr:mechanosensitive ion channel family protein [Lysobacter auxotrophicus]BDU16384.1 mechanosensitive ion channel family protein [Lysobacter auxotrophicus]
MTADPTPQATLQDSLPNITRELAPPAHFSAMTADQFWAWAMDVGIKIGGALLVFYIGHHVAKWIVRAAGRGLTRAHVEATSLQFISRVIYIALLIVLLLAILQGFFGIAPTSFIAILGAAGLAIGLALKDSLSNVASGVMLVTLKPFRVGDVVQIGGSSGTVENVSIFQTKLRGADNQTIVLPNNLITTAPIVNLTPDTRRRIELIIGIGYQDDIDLARAAIMGIMKADKRIFDAPAPDVVVYELADVAVRLGVRCHVSNADHFATKCDLNERIKKAFDRADISIQQAQRDIRAQRRVLEAVQSSTTSAAGVTETAPSSSPEEQSATSSPSPDQQTPPELR